MAIKYRNAVSVALWRVAWLKDLRLKDLAEVGGKNASLGEMIGALAAAASACRAVSPRPRRHFREFIAHNGLEKRNRGASRPGSMRPMSTRSPPPARRFRSCSSRPPFPAPLEEEIREHYQQLERQAGGKASFAVRSSATAEDLPEASFAGQQETFLNISGADNVLEAIRHVFASLYNDRAISYRVHQGFAHGAVALSAAVQQMVRSDLGASGVLFTLDTESGFRDVVFITASYGLGEMVVQGAVNPDEFYVHKADARERPPGDRAARARLEAPEMVFSQSAPPASRPRSWTCRAERHRFLAFDEDILELARYAVTIERHYGRPMDIEWGKDGADGASTCCRRGRRPVKSRKRDVEERFALKGSSRVLVSGRAIGNKIGSGTVRLVADASKMSRVKEGDILGHRHDRPELGAGHEGRGRHRHQSAAGAPATPRSSRASSAFPRWWAAARRPGA
jgi:pyruvate,water dikinase